MPQGQIRKGFFFYFGLFVLLLIAVFMVCLVVMMFNPGNTVLWMQYFTGNEVIAVTKTSDTSTAISWGSVENLEINCSYATVVLQRNKEYTQDGIEIVNKAKGFTAASTANDFKYNVHYEGNTLVIDVEEPTGFFYLSKDIEIVIHSFTENSAIYSRLNLIVNATDGEVNLGGTTGKGAQTVGLASAKIKTGKGNIYVTDMFNMSNLSSLSFETTEGNIFATKTINYTANGGVAKNGTGLDVNCDVSLSTVNGNINYNALNLSGHTLTLGCKKGNIVVDYINASSVQVKCYQGNYKFGDIYGDLSYVNSEDSILAPNILVNYISRNFTLSTIGNANAEPDVTIKQIDGTVSVIADKGTVVVKQANGAIDISSEKSLGINLTVGENNSASKRFITETGNITLSYLGNVAGSTTVKTNTGKTTINITNVAKFTADAFLNELEGANRVADSMISVSLGLQYGETKNPLSVNGTSSVSGTIDLKTNSSISYVLVSKESLAA